MEFYKVKSEVDKEEKRGISFHTLYFHLAPMLVKRLWESRQHDAEGTDILFSYVLGLAF